MESLPVELIIYIFKNLSYGELARCSVVCKQWYAIVHNNNDLAFSKAAIVLDYSAIQDPNKIDKFFEQFSTVILDRGRHLNIVRLTLIGWSVNDLISRWDQNWIDFFYNLEQIDIVTTDSSVIMWWVSVEMIRTFQAKVVPKGSLGTQSYIWLDAKFFWPIQMLE